jgi:hypothetical protein
MAMDVIVPEFSPKSGVKIQVQENETVNAQAPGNELVVYLTCIPFTYSIYNR